MGVIYFIFMMCGAFGYRLPPAGWKPEGWTPPASAKAMITTGHVHLKDAHKTAQFWLIWAVLCLNVSAGIGIIGAAAPMLQETFGGQLVRRSIGRLRQFHRRAESQGGPGRRGLCRPVLAVQYRRPFLLGLAVRQDRAEGHLLRLLHARLHLLRRGADARHARHARAVRRSLLPDRLDVWRRLRHHSRPTSPTSSARNSSAPFTAGCSPPGRPPGSSGR